MALTNFYKTGNVWVIGESDGVPAGTFVRNKNGDDYIIRTPESFSAAYTHAVIARGKYSDFCDVNGVAYASLAAFKAATDDFFVKALSGGAVQAALDLKQAANVGIDQLTPVLPIDIVIDPVANTLTVATIKGGEAISALNPLIFYTDGSGIVNRWTKTAPVVFNFTNTNGIWYFHFDNTGAPIATQTAWSDFKIIAAVYRFYLNDQKSNTEKIVKEDWECHTNVVSAETHSWMHANGTQVIHGFDSVVNVLPINASGVPTSPPNADGRNTCISLNGGTLSDDGLECTLINTTVNTTKFGQDLGVLTAGSLTSSNAALMKHRINDALGRLDFTTGSSFPFLFNATSNAPEYITQAGVRTLVTDNRWFVTFIYAFPDPRYGECVNVMSADQDFTTYAAAQAYTWSRLQALYATARDPEVRPLYQMIAYCDKSGGGAYSVACKYAGIVALNDIRKTVTALTTQSGSSSISATNVSFVPTASILSTDAQNAINEAALLSDKLEIIDSASWGANPTKTLTANATNRFTAAQVSTDSVTITLGAITNTSIVNNFVMTFRTGATVPTITLPTTNVKWAGGIPLTTARLQINSYYEVLFEYLDANVIYAYYQILS